MTTHIIYISGLGDHYDGFRASALKLWRLWGVTTEHVPIMWYDGGSMHAKLQRIEVAIERAPKGSRLVLIGESAGATLALHMAERKKVDRIITLCGVTQPDTPVSNYLRRRAPALHEAVSSLGTSYTTDIHSVRAVIDGVVGKKHSVVRNASTHVIWTVGHLSTIVLCLTVLSPYIASIAKKSKK